MTTPDKTASILIVGGGTFGLSTAWHLARNGYTCVTVLDRHECPSQDSAGYDLNKIFRTEYADPVYSKLSHEARAAWLGEPVLRDSYHEVGYIFAVSDKNKKSVQNWQDAVNNSIAKGVQFEQLHTAEDFRAKAPVLNGPMTNWRGVYNAKAGWTHAYNALDSVYKDCKQLGVNFRFGASGTVKAAVINEDGSARGVELEDGSVLAADRVILACGAWLDSIIDTHGQCLAKCWCFAHIQLSEEEAAEWKNMPVVNQRELGYLFEPDVEGRRLKIAPHGVGYTHYISPGKSYPRSKSLNPSDSIPSEAKAHLRELLKQCLPDLADRPFIYERMCWDADTPDAHFLITDHPDHKNLFVAGGASAHGFKFLPNIGKHVLRLIEGALEPELREVWKWRPHQQIKQDTSRPDRPPVDLSEVEGWAEVRTARL